jgi:hypothetical protein
MAYTKYSLTPANNTAAPPDGAPEGMLPSAVNDTMRDMMAQIRDVGDGVRDGTYTMTAPKITGGTITGVTLTGNTLTNPVITGATLTTSAFNGTVGATTASTGAFTTLSTSSTTTLSGLTASTALALDASKNVVSVTNTGTGSNVLSASPTLTGTIAGASLSLSSLTSGRVTYAGASGLLSDSATLTYNGTTLTASTGANFATTSGSVGIGTSSPTQLVDITTTGATNSTLVVQNTTASNGGAQLRAGNPQNLLIMGTDSNSGGLTGTANASFFYTTSTTPMVFMPNGVEKMRITSAGNVGIGTSSPSAILHTVKATSGVSAAFDNGGQAITEIDLWNNGVQKSAWYYDNTNSIAYLYATTGASLGFSTNATEKMRIDSSGNVGIGVTPSAWSAFKALEMSDGSYFSTYNFGGLYIGNNNYYNGSNFIYKNTGPASLYLQSGNHIFSTVASGTAGNTITFSERMRIDTSGNLLVGTTSAGGRFAVQGTTADATATAIYASNSSTTILFQVRNDGAMNTGLAGVSPYNNTTATSANLVVAADGFLARSTSARKYKQDIRDLESIDISKFRPVRYKSKSVNDDQTKDHFGIIADEIDEAGIKELVTYGTNGEVEGFQYERLTVVLLKELQTLRAEFDAYKATHP